MRGRRAGLRDGRKGGGVEGWEEVRRGRGMVRRRAGQRLDKMVGGVEDLLLLVL